MKKYSLLSLILILLVIGNFAAADLAGKDVKAKDTSMLLRSNAEKPGESAIKAFSVNPRIQNEAKRRAGEVSKEDAIKQNIPQKVKDRLRLEEITADGVISSDEADEYLALRASQEKPDFPPVVMNTVTETEPNNDCGSANSIAPGDTVQCAYIDYDTDPSDYFTFTLDNTYASWLVSLQILSGWECGAEPWDVVVTIYNSDCSEVVVPVNEWGYGSFQGVLAPGTYVIHCNAVYSYNVGYYHLVLNAGEYAEQPGDNCGNPLTITLPSDIPYSDLGQTTCGRINDYTETCMGDYDGGEDIIYEINVTSADWYQFDLNPYTSTDLGMSIGPECPPVNCVLNEHVGWQGGTISQIAYLEVGTYYLIIDCATWNVDGSCIPQFDLAVGTGTPPLEGEFCSNAIVIPDPTDYTDTRDLSLYNNDLMYEGPDCVYTFTLDEPKHLWFSTCGSPDEFSSVLWLYGSLGDCGSWNYLISDEWEGCDYSNHVKMHYDCPAGTYYLIVDASIYNGDPGEYTLDIYQFVPVCNDPGYVPPNDSCQQVTPVIIPMGTTYTFTGNSCNSTQDNPYLASQLPEAGGVWLAFETLEQGNVTISFCQTTPTRYGCFNLLFTDCADSAYLSPYTVDFEACPGNQNPVLVYMNVPAGVYYYNVMNLFEDQWGSHYWSEGPYVVDVTLDPFNEISCPPGASDEGENQCLDYNDTYNGGCWADDPHFESIDSGAVICGFSGNPGVWTRDWDYYEYVATDFRRLEFKVVMESPVYISIRDGSNGCAEEAILVEATADTQDTAFVSLDIQPGTYWMTVAPNVYNGWQCPIDYVAFFDAIPIAPYYCDPCLQYSSEYISHVAFNTIDNYTASEGDPCYYGDYTSVSTQLPRYSVNQLSVQVVSSDNQEHVRAWIDWNNDYVFQESESYYLGYGGDFTATKYISVPGNAVLGETRMRIVIQRDNDPYPWGSCPNGYYGEIEDYSVEIVDGEPAEFSVDPASIAITVGPRESASQVMTVTNSGATDLMFSSDAWMDPPAPAIVNTNNENRRASGGMTILDLRNDYKPRVDSSPNEPGLILQGGDDISTATAITEVPSTLSGTTFGYNDDYYEACPLTNTGGADVVYSYTPTQDQWLTFNLCLGETEFDSRMYIYENAVTPGNPYRCNEDACASPAYEYYLVSRLNDVPVYAGNTYYIIIDGFDASAYGNYVLNVMQGNPQSEDEECDDDGTLVYGQRPARVDEMWGHFTSDTEYGWLTYDNYGGAWGEITGITFWGADATLGWWWEECDAASEDFVVTFYDDDNGQPGTVVYADTATGISGVPTGIYHDIFEQKRYSIEFDSPVYNPSGWISVQAISAPDNCVFLWMDSPQGDGYLLQQDQSPQGAFYAYGYDLAFCLRGTPTNWLTMDVTSGIVPPDSSIAINITLDAANIPEGVHTGAIRFETTDPANPNPSVPATFTIQSGYQYLPGDANMFNGTWPPAVIGSDVTYLVNYFRGVTTNQACLLGGFYAAADVNGSCTVIGSDVTRLVNYFRGQGEIEPCPDYAPAWLTPADCPEDAPSGWPNCETPVLTGKKAVEPEVIK